MIYGNKYHEIKVLTSKGIKSTNKLYPYDKLYDYLSDEYLIVKKVIPIKYDLICNVIYDDNRSQLIGYDDFTYIGNGYISQLNEDLNWIRNNIELKEFKFNDSYNPMIPDPYIAGILLVYGDQSNEYISLPSDIVNGNNVFAYKYKVDYANILENNKVYFAYINDLDKRITWEEFFPNYIFYAKTHNKKDPIIPYEYQFASLNDRKQFIRGIFDVAYDKDYFQYNDTIIHEDENVLKEIQKILYSLKIPSRINYTPYYKFPEDKYPSQMKYNRNYTLEIIANKNNYPGFFYYVDYIKNMIYNNQNEIIPINKDYRYKIKEIKPIGPGVLDNIILDKKNAVYVTDSYLPRISL